MVSHDTERGSSMAGITEIAEFLHEVKTADFIVFVPRRKNEETRLSIGLTAYDQEDIIRNLKVEDYYSGPHNDHDISKLGMIWIFKHSFEGHMLYIKIKEKNIVEGKKIIKCISLHIDEV